MKTITDKEYRDATNCSQDFRIYDFTLTEVQEFLNRKGYDLIIHRTEQNVEHRRSVPLTGETESLGYIDTMVQRVLAVKPGTSLPTVFNKENLIELGIRSVFQREISKNILA